MDNQIVPTPATARQFYALRTFSLRSGPQLRLTQDYIAKALIPALNRLGVSPVGAFSLEAGPETPKIYALIPSSSVEFLATLDTRLAGDGAYLEAADGFLNAPATAPAFARAETSLLRAFAGWPALTQPAAGKRIFQLRTYESASQGTHARKVQMFDEAEAAIFTRLGMSPVFFAATLVGTRMPSLTYMLSFPDAATMAEKWAAFAADPTWTELSQRPGNSDAEIVSNITNLYLSPLECSQI